MGYRSDGRRVSVLRPVHHYPGSPFHQLPSRVILALRSVLSRQIGREFSNLCCYLVGVLMACFDRVRYQVAVLGQKWRSQFSDDRSDDTKTELAEMHSPGTRSTWIPGPNDLPLFVRFSDHCHSSPTLPSRGMGRPS